jgi:hypothetical protein
MAVPWSLMAAVAGRQRRRDGGGVVRVVSQNGDPPSRRRHSATVGRARRRRHRQRDVVRHHERVELSFVDVAIDKRSTTTNIAMTATATVMAVNTRRSFLHGGGGGVRPTE